MCSIKFWSSREISYTIYFFLRHIFNITVLMICPITVIHNIFLIYWTTDPTFLWTVLIGYSCIFWDLVWSWLPVISRLGSVLLCGGGRTLKRWCIHTALLTSPSQRYLHSKSQSFRTFSMAVFLLVVSSLFFFLFK